MFILIIRILFITLLSNESKKSVIYHTTMRYQKIPNFFVHSVFKYCVSSQCEREIFSQGWSYYNVNFDIADCSFSRTNVYNAYGGVVFISGVSNYIMINNTMFYSWLSSYSGGAIYFNSLYSKLRMICANMCSAGSSGNGHFAYLFSLNENHMDYVSITFCSHNTSGYSPIYIREGIKKWTTLIVHWTVHIVLLE